nr:hypothetical protein GCM10017611_78370 [Rhodococcus wratislaviensis]
MTQPRPTRRRPARPEGQWAHGFREPLNSTERFKRDNDGLAVRRRVLEIYSKQGFSSIDPSDLRGRFRWYGLYTQRRQGIDGGRTATLDPDELEDEHFMLRVRIPGGQLTTAQLRMIADLPTDRTSSCTGSVSRTYRRSGRVWNQLDCPPPRPVLTPQTICSATR